MKRLTLCLGMLSCLFLVVGCTTAEEYEAGLASWRGSNEHQLISAWGPPSGVYEAGGYKYLTWSSSQSGTIPVTYTTYWIGDVPYVSASGGGSYNYYCNVTMTLQKQIVIGWRYEGDACY